MQYRELELIEEITDAHGNSQAVYLAPYRSVPPFFRNEGIYEFEIVEGRKCKIPIESDCPENAEKAFLQWYHSHTDAVEDLLDAGKSARHIYPPVQTIPADEYPVDDLTYIRELPEDKIIAVKEGNDAI